jgi:hypothetical protein
MRTRGMRWVLARLGRPVLGVGRVGVGLAGLAVLVAVAGHLQAGATTIRFYERVRKRLKLVGAETIRVHEAEAKAKPKRSTAPNIKVGR